ncbi:MAG: ABC transporter [Deltaproteobacteria bacterium]|nr:ABC transporter [Deltaproteobacteria bacterium]
MGNIWVMGKKEFASYFASPIAYVAIAVFLVVVGLKFFVVDTFFKTGEASLRSFFELVPAFFVFYLPAIAMRLVSEEKRLGTFELLATLPVSDAEIVLGKFAGAVGFLKVTLLLTLVYPLLLGLLGEPDWGAIIGGYVGLLLVGSAFLAIGLMASTWTRSQIVAYIVGAVLSSLFFFIDRILGAFWEGAKKVAEYFSFSSHFSNFTRGVIDTRDLVFFLSMIALCLVVATFSLNRRRWN